MTTRPTADLPTPDSRPRLICFDLGGVVVRICRSWPEACAAAQIEVRHDARMNEAHRVNARRTLRDRHETGLISSGEYFQGIAEALGGVYTPDEIQSIHNAWILEHYNGVESIIASLARQPALQVACLSNTNASHWAMLTSGHHSAGVSHLHHKFASHIIGVAKPDEGAYRTVERLAGFAGDQIVFFDDMPENIEAAQRLGWRGHQIDHTGDTAVQIREHLASHSIVV